MRTCLVVLLAISVSSARATPPASAPSLALPSPDQLVWQDLEVGAFIHFAPNTWQDQEYDNLSTPLDKINPRPLTTDQWVEAAQAMGARYLVFVAKHAGGFCMWRTQTTDYSIRKTAWRAGNGDVLRDLTYSCLRRGLRLGVYISPQDGAHGAGVGGKCASPENQDEYNNLYRQQLTEVLRYTSMAEVWFDGSTVVDVGDILRKLAPKAMIFQSLHATIRWVGNEEGVAPEMLWNPVGREVAGTGTAQAKDGLPGGDVWLPVECDARLRRDWFWNSGNVGTLKSVEQLMDMYYQSVGHGANLLLNLTPDTTGLIPAADLQRAAEFGNEVRRRFAAALGATRGPAEPVAGGSGAARWALELDLPESKSIDNIVMMEDIAHGQRVAGYYLEVSSTTTTQASDAQAPWVRIAEGTTIGHKKLHGLARPVQAGRVRMVITDALAQPLLRRFAVYYAGPMPERYRSKAAAAVHPQSATAPE